MMIDNKHFKLRKGEKKEEEEVKIMIRAGFNQLGALGEILF